MLKRFAIFVHRWLGVALCLVFLLWFPSGIAHDVLGLPGRQRRRSAGARAGARSIEDSAVAGRGIREARSGCAAPGQARLNTYDGRPAYRFRAGRSNAIVFADTGEERGDVSMDLVARIAAAWTSQPANAASVTEVTEVDQWTLQTNIGNLQPLWKYTWPNGEHVYVSQASGEVVQYTTTASRLGAYAGPITHWFYFTPLRKNGRQWSRVVIWSSGIGTFAAILGLVVGVWMYSPRKRYRYDGAPTAIPYRGQKRWHMVLGLIFGIATATWAFSGMLSMEPFPLPTGGEGDGPREEVAGRIQQSLRARLDFAAFSSKDPREALAQLGESPGEGTGVHVTGRTACLHGDDRRRRDTHRPGRRAADPGGRSQRADRLHQGGRGTGRTVGDPRARGVRRVLSRSPQRAAAAGDRGARQRQPADAALHRSRRRRAWSAAIATATGSPGGSITDSTRSTSPGSTTTAPPGTSSSSRSCSAARGCASRRSCSHGECSVESWRAARGPASDVLTSEA